MTWQLDLFGEHAAMRALAQETRERMERDARESRERAHRTNLERGVRDYGLMLCPECGGDAAQSRWSPNPCPCCAGHYWLWPDGAQLSRKAFWAVLSFEEPEVVHRLRGIDETRPPVIEVKP